MQFSSYNKTALDGCQAPPGEMSPPAKSPRFFLAKTMRACYPSWKRNAVLKVSAPRILQGAGHGMTRAKRIPAKEDKS